MNFRFKTGYNNEPSLWVPKSSLLAFNTGDAIMLDANGLAVLATTAATAIAIVSADVAVGTTQVPVFGDARTEFFATADVNFAAAQRGKTYDLKETSGVQVLNQAATSTNVLKVSPAYDGGTVGSKVDVVVKIEKFIF